MDNKSGMISRLHKFYEGSKKWVAYGNLVLILLLLYFGSYMGSLKDYLLPVCIIGFMKILYEILRKVEENIEHMRSQNEFNNLNDALQTFLDAAIKYKKELSISIIAATGGTTVKSFLDSIIDKSNASKINISLLLIDSESPSKHNFPLHWVLESKLIIDQLRSEYSQLKGRDITIEIYSYDYLPVIRGVMLNNTHLLLGFFGWGHPGGERQLSGANRSHLYFVKGQPGSEYFFNLYEDWINNSPKKIILQEHYIPKVAT